MSRHASGGRDGRRIPVVPGGSRAQFATLLSAALALAACSSAPTTSEPAGLVLRGVAVVDGTGAPPVADRSAGLTPLDAITAATRNGARSLGIQGETGTIETGKSADLIVLGADPTADIRNTRSIELVLSQGRLLDPGERLSGR